MIFHDDGSVTCDLADVLDRKNDRCYSTSGEAFEDLLCDAYMSAYGVMPIPEVIVKLVDGSNATQPIPG